MVVGVEVIPKNSDASKQSGSIDWQCKPQAAKQAPRKALPFAESFAPSRFPWILCLVLICQAMTLAADDPLATLRAAHPRLIVLDDQITADKQLIQTNPQAGALFKQIQQQADKILSEPSVQHVLIGPRLLAQSRSALRIISTSAGMYRLTGDTRYAQRAKQEMLAVAAFADWNPSHFLDVAEMTNACGIGYDWIYDQLSEEDRRTIRQAIVEKAFKPAFAAYDKKEFWTKSNMNWSQVCAGGLTVGALAIADQEPEISRKMIDLAHQTIITPMKEFAPDGGWDEGPGYWNYATSYNVFYLSAIESALGTDFGLEKMPGFSNTGSYHIQLTGPGKLMFNFADAGEAYESAPQMFWLARRFNVPTYAAWERANSAGHMNIFHLLWFNPDGDLNEVHDLPNATVFDRVNVGVMRSSFSDPDAWYVAFKGGDNGANHSHLDLGSFVLDAMGQRWALDLGPDDYNLPGYFGKQRFTYFRLMTRAHNTLTFNGGNQDPKAKARIIWFDTKPERSAAIIDLSAGYGGQVRRGVALIGGKQVLIQDEFSMPQDKELISQWNFHTRAKVKLDGRTAVLSLGGKHLKATLLSPAEGKFEMEVCDAPPPQKANAGVVNLFVRGGDVGRFAVVFGAVDDAGPPRIVDLSTWEKK